MTDDPGAVRGFWFEGGPLVVFSQIGNSTVTGIENAVMAVVNEVMELAEGGDPPHLNDETAAGMVPAAPVAAPVAR